MVRVVSKTVVADGVTFDGGQFHLVEIVIDQPEPGESPIAYAVDLVSRTGRKSTVGFRTEDDARKYITTFGNVSFDVADRYGNHETITHNGLGIPPSMVRDHRAKAAEPAPPAEAPVPAV